MRDSNILEAPANRGALDILARVLRDESPLALVGAGMSIPSGFPSWTKLVDDMDTKCKGHDDDYRKILRSDSDVLWRAGEYRQIMGEEAFRKMMKTMFGRKVRMAKDDLAVAFARLPFRHFITTNYDDVIPCALEKAEKPAPRLLNWFLDDDVRDFIFALRAKDSTPNILHLHGHHSRPESIILSDNDYTERYVRSFGTSNKLFAIFSTERVVFAGFSLNDPDLMALMREVNATMRPKEARHFAIMGLSSDKDEKLERNRLRNRFGVEPVFYDSTGNNHTGLLEIVRWLQDSLQAPQPADVGFDAIEPAELDRRMTRLRIREIDPEDPEKGQWGGSREANHRKITARVRSLDVDWFEVTMEVRSTAPRTHPLTGKVFFHLHPTLIPKVRAVPVLRGVARLSVESYGAYTVGVETDDRRTRLELDLSRIKTAPLMFRMN